MRLFFLIDKKIQILFKLFILAYISASFFLYFDSKLLLFLDLLKFIFITILEFWIVYRFFFNKDREKTLIISISGLISKTILIFLPYLFLKLNIERLLNIFIFNIFTISVEILVELIIIKLLLKKRITFFKTLTIILLLLFINLIIKYIISVFLKL